MLIYTRLPSGDHVWKDAEGTIRLWRGATAWYFVRGPWLYDAPARLCDGTWPDGDAITMYRAKVKAHQIREANV